MAEEFVRLMTAHQGPLYGYILSLLGNPDAANDVLQETNVVLWRDSREFTPGTNFKAWAFRVAHFQVMAFRQKRIRDRLVFDEGVLEVVEPAARKMDERFEERRERLEQCLESLPDEKRDLLRRRYADSEPLESIGSRLGMTANAVTQSLFRIRQGLIQCVGGEGAP